MKRILIAAVLGVASIGAWAQAPVRQDEFVDGKVLLHDLQVLSADDMQGRLVDSPGGEKARNYVLERFKASGIKPFGDSYTQPFTFTDRGHETHGVNVIGHIDGTRTPARYIVVSGHYDHIGTRNGVVFNGADDNASGAAALFALATYFSTHKPANSLIFAAFDGEESGLRGGYAFVKQPPVDIASIVVDVNMDMIGRDPNDKLFAVGTVVNPFLKPILEGVAAKAPVKLLFGHEDPKQPEDWSKDSDHYAFQASKIPGIYLGVEDFDQHHKATDKYETMTFDFYIRATETSLKVVQAFDANLDAIVKARAEMRAADSPPVTEGNFVARNFMFRSGETLSELRLHYRTLGKIQKDARGVVTNAVLVMHGTGGTGAQFTVPAFAGQLFGAGQLLDATTYFIILTDGIGHGGSSKPSDGLRMTFPHYGYLDMVEAQYRLLTEGLGVNHARLVMGTSMGGMQTWLWGEEHPDFMDALMPLASVPSQIAGRNRAWRRVIIDAIRNDPAWKSGDYIAQPPSLRTAGEMLYLVSTNPIVRQTASPTLATADAALDAYVANYVKTNDANDVLYWFEASRDYDPAPGLEKIRAPLFAVNTADDLVNPPELKILDKEIARVPKGRFVVIPLSDKTVGHGSHTIAVLWKSYLEELLTAARR
jgi:homoserine O-acetyltransferase